MANSFYVGAPKHPCWSLYPFTGLIETMILRNLFTMRFLFEGASPLRRYLRANTRLPPMRGIAPQRPKPVGFKFSLKTKVFQTDVNFLTDAKGDVF
jgi:hypothetical protein